MVATSSVRPSLLERILMALAGSARSVMLIIEVVILRSAGWISS